MKLLQEIHRRSLWQVLGIYIAASWVVLQVVNEVADSVGLPEWVSGAAIILLLIGFPIVLATAFIQQGMGSRADEAPESASSSVDSAGPVAEPAPATARVSETDGAAPVEDRATHHRLFTWRNALLGGAAAFVLLGVLTGTWLYMRSQGIGSAGTLVAKGVLDERSTLLVADFESPDALIARAATEAFRIDLSQSPVVRVTEPGFVSAALVRMGRPTDSPLEPAVAQELAQREGIPAIITGEVTPAGGGYLLTAELVKTADGAVLVSHRESATDSSEVLSAIDELSKRIRERIGESYRTLRADPPLDRVTTPSLEALQRYSQARHAVDVLGHRDRAVELYEEAIALDSMFAMAYRGLGIVLSNQGSQRARYNEAFRKAYQFRDRLTERERYQAMAAYYMNTTGEPSRAIAAYENLLELDPTDRVALNNLGVLSTILRDPVRAEDYYERAYESDRSSPLSLVNAATQQVQIDMDQALRTMARADSLFPDNAIVRLYEANVVNGATDYSRVEEPLTRLREENVGDRYLTRLANQGIAKLRQVEGRLADARQLLEEEMSSNEANAEIYLEDAIELAFMDILLENDPDRGLAGLEWALEQQPLSEIAPEDRPYLNLAALYAWGGRPARAREILAEYEELDPELRVDGRDLAAGLHRTLGAVALAEGRYDEAIAEYRRADEGQCDGCEYHGLAIAYDRAGQPDSAIAAYTSWVEKPLAFRTGITGFFAQPWGDGHFLPTSIERLGELHDQLGNQEKAAEYYARFVELWAEADPELQPRVEAAQARLEEIMRERG